MPSTRWTATRCPPWFTGTTSAPANLFCQNKRLPFGSVQGVQQGDPLGPLLFALGIRKVCKSIKEAWQNEQKNASEQPPGTSTNSNGQPTTLSKLEALKILSLWYLDDGIGMGPKEEVLKALEIVTEQAQKVGLRLNLAKCEVWSEDEAALADFPAEITRCKPEGFELLGVGIGSQALCEKILDKRVSKIAESLAMMTVVDDP